jgi:hypothetical protein
MKPGRFVPGFFFIETVGLKVVDKLNKLGTNIGYQIGKTFRPVSAGGFSLVRIPAD